MADKINNRSLKEDRKGGILPPFLSWALPGLAMAGAFALGLFLAPGAPTPSAPSVDTLADQESNREALLALKETDFSDQIAGIIVPHHLLVAPFMEKLYAEVAEKNSYKRVVILSPNHFGIGHNFLQSSDDPDDDYVEVDEAWITALKGSKTVYVEKGDFEMEHGVYVQYPFIAKYFPGAKVVPIIVKKDTPCGALDNLRGQLETLMAEDGGRTLIIASLDFTHYSDEKIALANDLATVKWLREAGQMGDTLTLCDAAKTLARGMDKENAEAVAIDSGEVLYVITSLMSTRDAGDFTFWERTSSASMVKSTPAGENTSHIFGYFSP